MRILLLSLLLSVACFGTAQTSISPLECVTHFYHGVASGDPLSDAVIIWTRITPDQFTLPVVVDYKMATDTGMVNIVAQGSVLTDETKDYTVKFDVTGLQPDTYYYFEFSGLGSRSPRGRTKTAPLGAVDQLRFAVVSCANLEAGFFNAYQAIAERNDVEAVLMLGDYIYEYEEGGYAQNSNVDRIFDPTHETLTLSDYRLRYSVYHMDQSLQRLHQNYPWICVWDDHESANDSYENGAENHNPGEGLWSDRKLAAQQAYFEWLPIRAKAPENYEIFRKFEYGDRLDLFMVDTRLHGRNEQGVNVNDPNRTILGADQYQWLTDELSASTAQWKILGNQVIMAPLTVFGIPINGDAWDGYPAERQNLLNHLANNSIDNFTVITGDVHTSWAFNLKQGSAKVGVEFVTPSVTSPGAPINGGELLMIENAHLKFVELTKHGFIILNIDQNRMQADWFFVNTIDAIDPSYVWVKSFYSNDGNMQLQETTSAALPDPKYDVTLAPICPRADLDNTGIENHPGLSLLGVYPNPTAEKLNVHFVTEAQEAHAVSISDLNGRELLSQIVEVNPHSSTIAIVDVSTLPPGTYLISIRTPYSVQTKRFVRK